MDCLCETSGETLIAYCLALGTRILWCGLFEFAEIDDGMMIEKEEESSE